MRFLLVLLLASCGGTAITPLGDDSDCDAYPANDALCPEAQGFFVCIEGAEHIDAIPLDLGPGCRPLEGGWCCP